MYRHGLDALRELIRREPHLDEVPYRERGLEQELVPLVDDIECAAHTYPHLSYPRKTNASDMMKIMTITM
jgi:hypothetical protein